MNFASLEYVGFLALVWVAYVVLPRRGQNTLLLCASYWFYAAWDWRFLSLILLSTGVDFVAGRVIGGATSQGRKRAALTMSVVTNLGLLCVFKYFGFFVDSAVELLNAAGLQANRPALNIVLPVGISFYTFQTLSYSIDIYRGKLTPTRSLLDFALFVAFFPQLVAGPIERAKHLLPILANKRKITADEFGRGLFLILLGLAKKVAIADGISSSVDAIYGTETAVSGLTVTLATYAFAIQILCDFSAYTDIARGTAKLFGIDLMINFNAPYFARSPSDFWRRWHISLSTWLRDYLYIPLGGNRGSKFNTYRNLMLTMVLGGLWHGAAWNFVLWGVFHGALLCGFRLFQREKSKPPDKKPPPVTWRSRLLVALGIAVFFQVTCYGWLLFRAESLDQIIVFTRALLTPSGWFEMTMPVPTLSVIAGLAFLGPWEWLTFRHDQATFYQRWPSVLRGVVVGVLLVLLAMGMSNDSSAFIYFQF